MAKLSLTLGHFLRRVGRQPADVSSDGELLARFHRERDQAAFALLVDRHAALVLGVCRRVLGHDQDAEDAFQATFLILAKKAATLDRQRSVGAWLYTVAHNLALKARLSAVRRQAHEGKASMPMHVEPGDATASELQQVLDAEIRRLPEKYRAPLVLCYLEGKTNEEAAEELGWPSGSMARRLARARDLLRDRLIGRGVAPAAAAGVGLGLTETAPAALREATVRAALLFAFPTAVEAAGALSVRVTALAEAGLHAMKVAPLRVAAAAMLLVLGALGTGTALLASGVLADRRGQEVARDNDAEPAPAENKAGPEAKPTVDRNGDPLPIGAVNRLGSLYGAGRAVHSVACSPDGKSVAAGTASGAIRMWDVKTGQQIGQTALLAHHEQSHPVSVGVAFSRDGKMLASAGEYKVRMWARAGLKEMWQAGYEINDPRREKERDFPGQHLSSPAFSPDGKTLAVGGGDGGIWLLEAATGNKVKQLKCPGDIATSLAFSADGKQLAVSMMMGSSYPHQEFMSLWDLGTAKEIHRFPGHKGAVAALAFSPNGKVVASATFAGRIYLWDAAQGKALHDFQAHPGPARDDGGGMFRGAALVTSMTYSPDGKMLAIAGKDKYLSLWEVATMRQRGRLKGHGGDVNSITFSPEGRSLFSGSDDATILVWGILRPDKRLSVPTPSERSPKEWEALADVDAAKGFGAMQALAAEPQRAVPFLKERLRPALADDPALERSVAELESNDFAVRQKATAELEKAGDRAAPALRKVLAKAPSLETRQRIEQLLQKLDSLLSPGGEALRALRAIEVLEHIGSPEARAVLERVGKGPPEAPRTQEARAALQRLQSRAGAE